DFEMEDFPGQQNSIGEREVDENRRPAWDDFLADEAGIESFPASDPPSWTLGRRIVPRPGPCSHPLKRHSQGA
ncbi:MAG TPA: hypothetical protein VGO93_15050, partial [Candidatus Xenobia bacterium]